MRVADFQNEHGKVWLNVASSDSVLPGFTNLDNSMFLRLLRVYPAIRPSLPGALSDDVPAIS